MFYVSSQKIKLIKDKVDERVSRTVVYFLWEVVDGEGKVSAVRIKRVEY